MIDYLTVLSIRTQNSFSAEEIDWFLTLGFQRVEATFDGTRSLLQDFLPLANCCNHVTHIILPFLDQSKDIQA